MPGTAVGRLKRRHGREVGGQVLCRVAPGLGAMPKANRTSTTRIMSGFPMISPKPLGKAAKEPQSREVRRSRRGRGMRYASSLDS